MNQDFEMTEEVDGEIVEITQGGAGVVQATTVNVTQGGIQTGLSRIDLHQGGRRWHRPRPPTPRSPKLAHSSLQQTM